MKSGEIAHPNMEDHTCGIRSMSFDDKVPKEHTMNHPWYREKHHTPSHTECTDTHTNDTIICRMHGYTHHHMTCGMS